MLESHAGQRWSPIRALVVCALVRYGCVVTLIPITRIHCGELTADLNIGTYERSGLQELKAFLHHGP